MMMIKNSKNWLRAEARSCCAVPNKNWTISNPVFFCYYSNEMIITYTDLINTYWAAEQGLIVYNSIRGSLTF